MGPRKADLMKGKVRTGKKVWGGGGGTEQRALCKGWFVQFTATLRGWVILFYNIDRQVLILTGQLTTLSCYINHSQLRLLLKILSNLCPCAILIKSTIFVFSHFIAV